jgi:hypothetical protein
VRAAEVSLDDDDFDDPQPATASAISAATSTGSAWTGGLLMRPGADGPAAASR